MVREKRYSKKFSLNLSIDTVQLVNLFVSIDAISQWNIKVVSNGICQPLVVFVHHSGLVADIYLYAVICFVYFLLLFRQYNRYRRYRPTYTDCYLLRKSACPLYIYLELMKGFVNVHCAHSLSHTYTITRTHQREYTNINTSNKRANRSFYIYAREPFLW